jgi:hypothetical protein|eukprot:SAG25_NODE_16_length_24288_cov_31.926950_14_plen_83_part_00
METPGQDRPPPPRTPLCQGEVDESAVDMGVVLGALKQAQETTEMHGQIMQAIRTQVASLQMEVAVLREEKRVLREENAVSLF